MDTHRVEAEGVSLHFVPVSMTLGYLRSDSKESTREPEAVGPSLVTQLPKQDRRGVWRDYNPDSHMAPVQEGCS